MERERPIKGAIRKEDSGGKKKKEVKVVWDEDNLIFNESQKVPRMRIDEPPTPYNYEYTSDTESTSSAHSDLSDISEDEKREKSESNGHSCNMEQDNSDGDSEKIKHRKKQVRVKVASGDKKMNDNNDMLNTEFARMNAIAKLEVIALEEEENRNVGFGRFNSSEGDDGDDEDDRKQTEKRDAFKKRRAAHYNEFQQLQQFRNKRNMTSDHNSQTEYSRSKYNEEEEDEDM